MYQEEISIKPKEIRDKKGRTPLPRIFDTPYAIPPRVAAAAWMLCMRA